MPIVVNIPNIGILQIPFVMTFNPTMIRIPTILIIREFSPILEFTRFRFNFDIMTALIEALKRKIMSIFGVCDSKSTISESIAMLPTLIFSIVIALESEKIT